MRARNGINVPGTALQETQRYNLTEPNNVTISSAQPKPRRCPAQAKPASAPACLVWKLPGGQRGAPEEI
jgi:hypothetical protein